MTTELSEGVFLTSAHLVATDNVRTGEGGGGGSGAGAPGRVSTFSGSVELGRRLLLAARHGNPALVLDLMAKGAPFTTDWLGTSPLHEAAAGAHVEACSVLLRAGVSRDSRTKVERTPLHLAAHAGHAPVCSLLLERGAAVDCRDMLRMTPLHWAAERGHLATVAALLKHGADPRAESKFHKTPLSLAAAEGHHAILRLMEDALEQREARRSVDALQLAAGDEQTTAAQVPAAEQQRALDSIQILQMQNSAKPSDEANVSRIKIEIENEPAAGVAAAAAAGAHRHHAPAAEKQDGTGTETNGEGGGGTGGAGGAADLLRKHGITLLPHDTSSTVLNAIQSGRTIVLSDAGKLMLKDTPGVPAATPVNNTEASAPTSKGVLLSGVPAAKGVILTAAPVKAPPAPGVKIFTLNNKLRARNENKLPIKRLINPQDVQIKLLPVTGDSKTSRRGGVLATLPIKAKARRGNMAGAGAGAGAASQPFKIIMQKSNIDKLMGKQQSVDNSSRLEVNTGYPVQMASSIDLNKVLQASNILPATTTTTTGDGGGGGSAPAPTGYGFMCVPAEFLSSTSTMYLRSQLITAHKTIHELNNEITSLKQRLASYEPV